MADMQREIDLCIELIEDTLGQEYDAGEDTKTLITEIPDKILQGSFVALRAQSESGTHYVNMRRPDIKSFLLRLAANSPTCMETYDGIKYRFTIENLSRESTPMSTLS
ncbi:hypothetical protein TEQG_02926 [Trichophyton equinum CBS 127.97]|uniref:Uncharacterized protein n=1 Tax=Trichophyton equinum (strain ATCC MYA-4606 / CBS 127.97) TaxID=559882 RepID=F2PPS5_TRIEC|nr:hypothetical protein TEQG_02926 [Trichophyton equinum CBS 127.97]